MKTKLTIIVIRISLVACSRPNIDSPKDAAEKYLSELSSDLYELGFYNALNHDSRSAVLVYNE